MANTPDADMDDDFSDLYKEYTGPPGSTTGNTQQVKVNSNKRSHAGSDEEDEPRDPNAVPTDFTSREAKVWEAKSKATERNWKKRKEEEMICKICGESGHFTQGCPSTLGANRKSQDFFERVPARDQHVRSLFTERVIQKIEKDVGCKIKMDEKFLIVSGKDRLVLAKGVDAVHRVIKEAGDQRGSSSSHVTRSRSPERSPIASRLQRSESQRSQSGPRNASPLQPRLNRHDKIVENRLRDSMKKSSRGSPQAYGNDRARGHPTHSKSPARPTCTGNMIGSYDNTHSQTAYGRTDGWDSDRRGSDLQLSRPPDNLGLSQTLEEIELEYEREAMELGRTRDKEEDDENYKHRELLLFHFGPTSKKTIREMRENYMKKLAVLRGTHSKQWDEFIRFDSQQFQQQARQEMSSSFSGYKHQNYSEFDGSASNSHYDGPHIAMDSRNRYPNHVENYPSRPHENFGDYQRQRRDGYEKAYNRY